MTRGRVTTGLPEDLAIVPPGPRLSAILADVEPSSLDDGDLIRYAKARQRQLAHENARLLSVLVEVGRRGDTQSGGDQARQWGDHEVACAMTWTRNAAGSQLALGRDITERLPVVFAALDAGEIDHAKARIMSDWTSCLDARTAREVIDRVIGEAPRLTTGQLRALLARLVFAADPAARAERARQASVGRRVEARANDDGLADLHGYDLPPHRTVAAMERVDAIAKAAKNAGDGRTMPQLRADILLDLLVGEGIAIGEAITGCPLAEDTPDTPPTSPARPAGTAASETPGAGAAFPDEERAADADDPIDWSGPHEPPEDWYDPARDDDDRSDQNYLPTTPTQPPTAAGAMPGPRRGVLDLQMSLTTLMGLTDHPGDLNGFGPVIADIARQVAAENPDMTWRYSIYDRMGTLIHHGLTRRRPTAIDAAFIRARDRTCRAPGCRAPAHRCDLDHSEAWSESGNTSRPNLSALCRTHHTWKHLPGTELVQLDDGVIAWKTPLGQCVTTHPAAYLHDY